MKSLVIKKRMNGSYADAGIRSSRGDHDLNPGMQPARDLRQAAVLVPLIEHDDGLTVLLTKRTDHLDHHPGQISFPGGRIEEDDASPEDAALREAEEEVGLTRDHVDIIGRLDEYVVRTGFSVTPFVGLVKPGFNVVIDDFEVAEVFEVPLAFFMDENNHRRDSRTHNGEVREFYAMPYDDYYIWGATAGMLRNLYDILKPKEV